MSQLVPMEEYEKQYPLAKYSFYANGRVQVLLRMRVEILRELDKAFQPDAAVVFEHLARAEELSWLWMLGAYEVVRTMCQAKDCFSQRAHQSLQKLKKELAVVRMPAAKMEAPGKSVPISSSRSPAGPAESGSDILVGDPAAPRSLRELMSRFYSAISQIGDADILAKHESTYSKARQSRR